MTCQTCGRPAENGQPTHWLGCEETRRDKTLIEMVEEYLCEHGVCVTPRKPWSGRGAKPKYCEEHSDPKNRK